MAPEPLITGVFGPGISADNPSNPFGQPIQVSRRMVEAGPRREGFDIDSNTRVEGQALAANTYDFFAPLTPAELASLGLYRAIDSDSSQLASLQANLRASLFKLASDRPVGLAVGYELRGESGAFQPDPVAAAGLSFDFNPLPVKGNYHANEGFAELVAPVLDDLELRAALRVFDYSTFGGGSTYELGATWRPIQEVTLRAGYSTAFRAPDLTELYGARTAVYEPVSDPCEFAATGSALGERCKAVAPQQGFPGPPQVCNADSCGIGAIPSTVGGNPALGAERADIGTLGAVFEPGGVRGLSVSADWKNIKVMQTIGPVGAQNILNGCYLGGNDAYCLLIRREPNYGDIINILDLNQNVGTTQTSALDFGVRYGLPTKVGRFGVLLDATYLIYYRQTLPGGQVVSAAGNYDLGAGTPLGGLTPRLKFNAGIDYSRAGVSAALRMRYLGGFDECAGPDGTSGGGGRCSLPSFFDASGNNVAPGTPGAIQYAPHRVPAYVTFDLSLSYLLRSAFGQTTFSAGVHNLFDQAPPYAYDETFMYTDPAYDLAGRFVYGRVSQQF